MAENTLTQCYFEQTCTHLLKTINTNTKTEDRNDNSEQKIIMSRGLLMINEIQQLTINRLF